MLGEYKLGSLSQLFGNPSTESSGKDFTEIFEKQQTQVEQAFNAYTEKEKLQENSKSSKKQGKRGKKRKNKDDLERSEEIVTISGIPAQQEVPSKKKLKNKSTSAKQNDYVKPINTDLPEVEPVVNPPPKIQDDPEKTERTLFVGNVPQSFTKKKLIKLFKPFGTVESTRFRSAIPETPHIPKKSAVIEKKFHPQSNNINAYVVMASKETADAALQLNGTDIKGHKLRVDLAGNNVHDHKRSVYICNMFYGTSEEEIREFFQECGEIINIRIIRDKLLGIGKGFGYVLFSSVDAVMLALQKNGEELCGRNLRVLPAKSESKLKKKDNNRFGARSNFEGNRFKRSRVTSNFEGERGKQDRRTKKDIIKKIRHPRQRQKKGENNMNAFVKANQPQTNARSMRKTVRK